MTLGPVAKATIEERRREAAAILDCIKRGEGPKPPKPAREPTVADLAERCFSNHVTVRCKPNTAKNHRIAMQGHILSALGTKALKDVVPGDVTALHHKLRDTPYTANQAMWVLSKMFAHAGNWGMLPPGRNPCRHRHVRYFREKSRERFLRSEEYRRLGGGGLRKRLFLPPPWVLGVFRAGLISGLDGSGLRAFGGGFRGSGLGVWTQDSG